MNCQFRDLLFVKEVRREEKKKKKKQKDYKEMMKTPVTESKVVFHQHFNIQKEESQRR